MFMMTRILDLTTTISEICIALTTEIAADWETGIKAINETQTSTCTFPVMNIKDTANVPCTRSIDDQPRELVPSGRILPKTNVENIASTAAAETKSPAEVGDEPSSLTTKTTSLATAVPAAK
ncbi:Hypothetical protein CGLY_16560 (plasmid) [Corynebacterium glyciniphilum AJ 3170]|uniref:Uncharacterized protein n=1 Tax=Corynebacterium glyciniphilum AJ 3170 TaxID=1404245 RepID=X5EE65_9CORY|nr:Hypothetical protein CGLY_16560 [Corynebacterium glyciniphilum AJ 3170]